MAFLEKDYELPKQKSNYMKLEEGQNIFRVLSPAITGWEYWITDPEDSKKRKPMRVRFQGDLPEEALQQREEPKHFWAFVVFNRQEEQIQILELTQRTIMLKIEALVRSKAWGDPKDYDICITRAGKTMQETSYTVMPEPKKKLDKAITQLYEDMNIKLEKLYNGGDPFKDEDVVEAADKAIK